MAHTPKTKQEIIRFCITGTVVTAILYGIYYALLYADFSVDVSFTTGFIVSFACNFFLTNHYTFHTKVDFENGVRFSLCQAVNFFMQYVTLKLFIAIGIPEKVALVPGVDYHLSHQLLAHALNAALRPFQAASSQAYRE